jgi:hypothetical protein
MIGAIGLALDAQRSVNPDVAVYDAGHFKLALCIQFVVIGFGLWRFGSASRKLRSKEVVS